MLVWIAHAPSISKVIIHVTMQSKTWILTSAQNHYDLFSSHYYLFTLLVEPFCLSMHGCFLWSLHHWMCLNKIFWNLPSRSRTEIVHCVSKVNQPQIFLSISIPFYHVVYYSCLSTLWVMWVKMFVCLTCLITKTATNVYVCECHLFAHIRHLQMCWYIIRVGCV